MAAAAKFSNNNTNITNTNMEDYDVLGENNSSSFYNITAFPAIPIQLKGMETRIEKQKVIFKDIFSTVEQDTLTKIQTYLDTKVSKKTIRDIIKQKISTKPMRILQEIINTLKYENIICRKIKLASLDGIGTFKMEPEHSKTIQNSDIISSDNCKIFVGVIELIRKKFLGNSLFCDHMNSLIVDLKKNIIFVFEPKGTTQQPQLNNLNEIDIKKLLSSDLAEINKDYFKDFEFIKNSQSFLSCPQGICRDTDCQTYSLYGNLLYILNRDNIPENKSGAEKYINDILFSSKFMNTNKINLLLILVADLLCKNKVLATEVQWGLSNNESVCVPTISSGGGKSKKTNKSKKTRKSNKSRKSKKTKKTKKSK
jgi:hypothetical protein